MKINKKLLPKFIKYTKSKSKQIRHNLISKEFHYNRLSIYFLVLLFVGIALGGKSLIGLISAFNDTTYTWEFNSSTSGDYTVSNATVDNSGAFSQLTNQFTNPGFESGVTSWQEWGELDFSLITHTGGVAKRNSAGPFAAGVIHQGAWGNSQNDGGGTNDRIDAPRGNQISGNFYESIDTNQLTIAFWITPEWNGNDGEFHGMLGVSGGSFRMWKTSDGNLSVAYGGQSAAASVSSWVAGTTYSVVIRIDSKATLNGTNYMSISINDVHTFASTVLPTVPAPLSTINIGGIATASYPSDAIIEGFTIYRRVLYDGTYGTDMGNGDEIAQIYNAGTGRDPTLVTGSWDVVLAVPTNGTLGPIVTGTGNAWSHPHSSNLLGGTNGSNGFMMAGNYATDGWTGMTSHANSSLSFDGGDYVKVVDSPSLSLTDGMTLSMWIKRTGGVGTRQIFSGKGDGNSAATSEYWVELTATNSVSFSLFNGINGSSLNATDKIIADTTTWHHVAITKDATTMRVYLDGSPSAFTTAFASDVNDTSLDFGIGRLGQIGSLHYNGLIDDVRLFDRALTAQEIQDTMYKTTLAPAEEVGLLGRWIMSEGSGQTTADSSGNGNNGTLGATTGVSSDDPTWSTNVPVPVVSTMAANQKIYSGGYAVLAGQDEGIYRDVTVVAGNDAVVRGVAHSDGTCQPKLILYDQTNGAEIGSLTGTTTSTKGAPNNLLFTGEAPAGMTTLRVKLVNAGSAGTCYWHQVELYSNLISNPSMETGTGDPWIPTGWTNIGLSAGESVQETTIKRSGNSSLKFSTNATWNEGVNISSSLSLNRFLMSGVWVHGNAGQGSTTVGATWMNGIPLQTEVSSAGGNVDYLGGSQWGHVSAIFRKTSGTSINLRHYHGQNPGSNDNYFDDSYVFALNDVSLTVTPATLLNSTETTGIRVDGWDNMVLPLSNLTTDSGSVAFSITPRHSFSTVSSFGHNQPVMASIFGNYSNYIIVRKMSGSQVRVVGLFNGVAVNANWDHATTPIVLNAGTTYTFKVAYQNGGALSLTVDGVEVASTPLSNSFAVAPISIYLGTNIVNDTHYDATFGAPTSSPNYSEEAVNQQYGTKAIDVNATNYSILLNQYKNLGNTNSYRMTAYVKESNSAVVDTSIAQIMIGATPVATTYDPIGDGWYRLSATFVGTASARSYGLIIKDGYSALVDDITLKLNVYPTSYNTNAYSTPLVQQWDILEDSTTLTGDHAEVRYQVCNDDPAECNSTGWLYWNGSAWAVVSDEEDSNTALVLNTETMVGGETRYPLQWLDATEKKFTLKAIFFEEGASSIKLVSASLGLTTDSTPPDDVDQITLKRDVDGETILEGGWTNQPDFHVSWPQVDDDTLGTGIKGYCLYVGQDQTVNPGDPNIVSNKGLLGNSPESIVGTTCDFVVGTGASIDFANSSYRGVDWVTASSDPYFINIVAVDNSGNNSSVVASFEFNYDDVPGTPPQYVSLPSGYVSSKDVTMLWPTSGGAAAQDPLSGVAGVQYKINTSGTWFGEGHTGTQDITDLLTYDGSYTMDETYDYPQLEEGENVLYMRVWDIAGNVSTNYTVGAIKLNTVAPSEPQNLEVSPESSDENSYSFAWTPPSTFLGYEGEITYCYTINTLPSLNTCSWTGAGITMLNADAFATQPGENVFYVVARDEAGNINFGTYTDISFSYTGEAPGIPTSLEISDISIKASQSWKLALSWSPPLEQGAGVESYQILRSEVVGSSCNADISQFAQVGVTSGTSYVDSGLQEQEYAYCVKACDSANSCSATGSTVRMLPTGRYYEAAEIVVAPRVLEISTRSAIIEWATARASDSKIQFGLSSGEYFKDEIYRSDQEMEHSITLSNLDPGTEYFFRAKWTDGDGNTGISSEYLFKTAPAPAVSDVAVTSIDIDSAIVEFTTVNAVQADLRYGLDSNYGGSKSVNTSFSESRYSIRLDALQDGSQYHYAITLYDAEGYKYDIQEDNVFTTLPRPRITDVKFQQARDTASPTIFVVWKSNTEISTSVTYYPVDDPSAEFELAKTELKLDHQMLIDGLGPDTTYRLKVSGKDRRGNLATSEEYSFTTASDTRAPRVFDVEIQINELPVGFRSSDSDGTQITVTWSTDEPSTSQVEYGEGSGDTYTLKSSENLSLTNDHVVILSGLNTSSAYHLRVISNDKAGNSGKSIDYVTITPKASAGSFDIIMKVVGDIWGN